MANASDKTVRFTQIVEHSGEPRVHTLWLPPEKDPELQKALKTHRVMTVEPGASGSKTDVGTVGLNATAGKSAQVLVFPKSLQRFEGARIVGIKFDLVAQPKLDFIDPVKHAATTRKRQPPKKSPPPPVPVSERETAEESEEPPARTPAEPESPASEVVPFEPPPRETSERESAAPPRKSRPPRPTRTKEKTTATHASATEATLIREIRAAMKDLERGKSVAAYQRLERAISKSGN